MAALKKRSEARFWDNDDALLGSSEGAAANSADDVEDGDDSSDGTSSEDDRSSQEEASGSDSDEEIGQEGTATGSSRSSTGARKAGGVSDMDWLRSKVDKGAGGGGKATAVEDSESGSEDEEDEEGSEKAADASEGGCGKGGKRAKGGASGREAGGSPKQAGQNSGDRDSEDDKGGEEEESGLSVGRLFVRNLPYTCTEDDLRELFGSFGMLSEVHLPVDDVKRVRFSSTA